VPFEETLQLAQANGFAGIDVEIEALAALSEERARNTSGTCSRARSETRRVGLPVNWRGSDEEFQAGLQGLPRLAAAGRPSAARA